MSGSAYYPCKHAISYSLAQQKLKHNMFIQRYSRNVSQCCKTEILTEKVLFLHQIQGPPNNFFFFFEKCNTYVIKFSMLSPLGQRETKTYGMVNSTEVGRSSLQDEFRQGSNQFKISCCSANHCCCASTDIFSNFFVYLKVQSFRLIMENNFIQMCV